MNTDDPNFTAYALDELEPAERERLSQALSEDAAGRTEIAELKSLSARLRRELAQEGPMELTPARRAALLAEAKVPRRMPSTVRVWIPSAIAACLVLLFGAGIHYTGWRPGRTTRAVETPAPQELLRRGTAARLSAGWSWGIQTCRLPSGRNLWRDASPSLCRVMLRLNQNRLAQRCRERVSLKLAIPPLPQMRLYSRRIDLSRVTRPGCSRSRP